MCHQQPFELRISAFREDETTFTFGRPIRDQRRKSRLVSATPSVRAGSSRTSSRKPSCDSQESSWADINRLRVLYFFSQTSDISDFLQKFSVSFTIVGRNRTVLAEASCLLMSDYIIYGEEVMKADRHRRNVKLCTSGMQLLTLDVTTGLCMDGELDITKTPLYKYAQGNVYYPENSYYNSFPLPEEWMEIFRKDTGGADTGFLRTLDESNQYSPEKEPYEPSISMAKLLSSLSPKVRPRSSVARRMGTTAGNTRPALMEPHPKKLSVAIVAPQSARPRHVPNLRLDLAGEIALTPASSESSSKNSMKRRIKKRRKVRVKTGGVQSPMYVSANSEKRNMIRPSSALSCVNEGKRKVVRIRQSRVPVVKRQRQPHCLAVMKSPYGDVVQLTRQLVVIKGTSTRHHHQRNSSMPEIRPKERATTVFASNHKAPIDQRQGTTQSPSSATGCSSAAANTNMNNNNGNNLKIQDGNKSQPRPQGRASTPSCSSI